MEKFYIVTNETFLKEIDDFKKNEEKRNEVIKDFFQKNGIAGTGYYIRGDGLVNCPFREGNKESIELYVDDCEENALAFGKQLLKKTDFGGCSLRRFRKGSAILKTFQSRCIEEQVVINNFFHREGDYFEELRFIGYSVTRLQFGGKYYLRMSASNVKSITPKYEGFEEIKGSEFYKVLEEYKQNN